MRKLLVVLGIVALCSAPVWADSVVDVDEWVKITAPNGAVENINVNFLFNNNFDFPPSGISGEIVLGSLTVTSSGFMGTFSPLSPQGSNLFYLGLFDNFAFTTPPYNAPTDEIDLDYDLTSAGIVFTPGINTINGNNFAGFYSCGTAACTSAYGTSWSGYGGPPVGAGSIQEGSDVTTVPDGDSSLPLSLSAFCAFALAWRWRRREVLRETV
jgi:hypothetical protein